MEIFYLHVLYLIRIVAFAFLHFHAAHGGDFLYLQYPPGSQPNNSEAQEICQAAGYGLAVIDSQSEKDRMQSYFESTLGVGFSLPSAFWVGAYYMEVNGVYNFYWSACGQITEVTYAFWEPGEPNGIGSETCMRITSNLLQRTIYCSWNYDVLCETADGGGGGGGGSCTSSSGSGKEEDCSLFAECWWTPAKIGLLAGFSGMATFFCLCCIGWKCICEPKNQVGDEYEVDEDDADEDENGKQVGHPSNGLSAIHDINKNYNMEETPVIPGLPAPSINSRVLKKEDAPWMSAEELSFSSRYAYKE